VKCPACERDLRSRSPVDCPTHEDWEERAAIKEHMARMDRKTAEESAFKEVVTWFLLQ